MATTLGQLLNAATDHTNDNPRESAVTVAALSDVLGALGHVGRAVDRLAVDGLDLHLGSLRERLLAQLATACAEAATLMRWPHSGPLTDLVGAAADVAGQARPVMDRFARWAVGVEFAATADHCARLGSRLVPAEAAPVLLWVRHVAGGVERVALTDPPTPAGRAILDRLVPMSYVPPGLTGTAAAAEAAAGLVAAIDRAGARGGLTVREFRTVCVTGQVIAEYTAAVAATLDGGHSGPPGRSSAVAWQVVREASAAFDDGRWGAHLNRTDVVAAALTMAAALRHDLGAATAIDRAAVTERGDLPQVLAHLQVVANQNPVLADQLGAVTSGWAAKGTLRAHAADLPRMPDMPEQQIRDVLAGRRLQVPAAALDPLAAALTRAGRLSTGLAVQLDQTADPALPPAQPRLTGLYAARLAVPGAGEHLAHDARHVEQALAAARAPFGSAQPGGPDRGR